jgi:hypothetical protein
MTLSEMMEQMAEKIGSFEFIPVRLNTGEANWVCQLSSKDFNKVGISKWHPTSEAALEAAMKEMG